MELLKDVNLLENKKLIKKINFLSIPLLIALFILFTMFSLQIVPDHWETGLELGLLAVILLSFALLIVVHEGIHGLFFKLFSKESKVKFGYKNGMVYATSPHTMYTKGQFAVISLAPFVLITSLLIGLFLGGVIPPFAFTILASMHGSSCVGDFYWVYLLIRAPKNALVEDTETGICFWKKD